MHGHRKRNLPEQVLFRKNQASPRRDVKVGIIRESNCTMRSGGKGTKIKVLGVDIHRDSRYAQEHVLVQSTVV